MGGRGTVLPYAPDWWFMPRHVLTPPEQAEERRRRGYSCIRHGEQLSGNSYSFFDRVLAQTHRPWHLLSYATQLPGENGEIGSTLPYARPHFLHADTFGMSNPTLRWVGDGKAYELYFDGLESADFLAVSGLEIDMAKKGGFVASKRTSRALRPYFLKGFFPSDTVAIHYKTQSERELKQWDGAGAISRAMLERIPLPEFAPEAKVADLQRELSHAGRVELTILTAKGQDKCHAVVVEDLRDAAGNPVDFVLPQDTKGELKLHTGETFVAVNFVHGQDRMRLDVQSLLHLYDFFGGEQGLETWLGDTVAQLEQGLQTGDLTPFFRLTGEDPLQANLNASPAYELLLSGLSANQVRFATKSLMNKAERTLESTRPDKFRFPVPGGRYYIMTAAVGKQVGALRKTEVGIEPGITYGVVTPGGFRRALDVPQGQVLLDPERGTIWVNEADWVELPDGATDASGKHQGIADILGGADQDDGCWVVPFTDVADGERKVLVWRSPNQQGEYVILNPHADNPDLSWTTVEGTTITYPELDSRTLPTRIDHQSQQYLNLVDPDKTGDVGQGKVYSVENILPALEQGSQNAGVLGMYCNALMLSIAIDEHLPGTLPAPLEMVIDGTVKTGANLSAVRDWCYAHSQDLLEHGVHIPKDLHRRLSVDRRRAPWEFVPPALDPAEGDGYAFDRVMAMKETYRERLHALRATYVDEAMPPQAIFDFAFTEPRWLRAGAEFNRLHTLYLREFFGQNEAARAALTEQSEGEVRAWLDDYTAGERYAILRTHYARDAWREIAKERASGAMSAADQILAFKRAEQRIRRTPAWEGELERISVKHRLRELKQAYDETHLDGGNLTDTQQHWLRHRLERYLNDFAPHEQDNVLIGALASLYSNPEASGDGGLWLLGEKAGAGYLPGIAQRTIHALRTHGMIGARSDQPIIFSPDAEAQAEGAGTLAGTWYTLDQSLHTHSGKEAPRSRKGFPRRRREAAKARVEHLSARINAGETLDLTVGRVFVGGSKGVGETLMAYTANGATVGELRQASGVKVQAGDAIRLERTHARDGDLRATFRRLPTTPSNDV
jgi:hypothetical protein